jgi:hypothetical protein
VGGTSTDISLIALGQARLRSAEVGGHRLFLRTLDVRTIGLGGGSMIRLRGKNLADVGPRSAHIAGLPYCCFSSPEQLREAKIILASPRPGDPDDYVLLETPAGERFALTLTCAANAARSLPPGDYAQANEESALLSFKLLAEFCGKPTQATMLARETLTIAAGKARLEVEKLAQEYKAGEEKLPLIGGGGGAGALVPVLGEIMKAPHRICPEAEVISAIGVALALVRESIERNMANPTPEDLLRIRQEAEEGAIRSGAAPDTISVEVEVDARQNLVRATASGATELRARDLTGGELSEEPRLQAAADSLGVSKEKARLLCSAGRMYAYGTEIAKRGLFGLSRSVRLPLRLLDGDGIVRLQLPHGQAHVCSAADAFGFLRQLLDIHTNYGDAGPTFPKLFLIARGRICNLSGLSSTEQVMSIAGVELNRLPQQEEVLLLIAP